MHEYSLAPAGAGNDNDEFILSARDRTSPAKQILTHIGTTTPDYDDGGAAAPAKTVELTRMTVETRVHEARFSGLRDVQVDGRTDGEDGNVSDATFSYAAGGDRSVFDLVRSVPADEVIRHPVTFTFTPTDAAGADIAITVADGAITVTAGADAGPDEVIAFLNASLATDSGVAAVMAAAGLRFAHAVDAAANAGVDVSPPAADGTVTITITSAADTLAALQAGLNSPEVDAVFDSLGTVTAAPAEDGRHRRRGDLSARRAGDRLRGQ